MEAPSGERTIRRESELREGAWSLPRTERSARILHRISLRAGPHQADARRAFLFLMRQKEGADVSMRDLELGLSPDALRFLTLAADRERLLYGDEDVPERQEFVEMRCATVETVRKIKAQADHEFVGSMSELIPEAEKRESALYRETEEILKNVARAMGIKRPVVLEITRKPDLNAFIFQSEREGVSLDDPSGRPLHVYVNAGLFNVLGSVFSLSGRGQLTKDHIAGVLAHELRHLQQPRYIMGQPPDDKETAQRFEYDSDLAGMEAADRAGYHPLGLVEVLEAVKKTHGNFQEALSTYFSGTHPITENRIKDLLAEYHRPENVFFSSENEMRSFSDLVSNEAKEWSRETFRAQLTDACTWEHWDAVIERLNEDPRATFADAEMAMEIFKIHLEARAALAVASHELETGDLGLRDALLFAANAAVSGEQIFLDIWQQAAHTASHSHYGGNKGVPPCGIDTLATLVSKGVSHDDPPLLSSVSREKVKEMVEAIYTDTLLVPQNFSGPFHSLEELWTTTSPEAEQFWSKYAPGLRTGFERMDNSSPAFRKRAVELALARLCWYDRDISTSYQGEQADIKDAVMEEIARAANAPLPEEPAVSGMVPRDWGSALGALSRRVAVIRSEAKERRTETAEGQKEKPRQTTRWHNVRPFVGLSSANLLQDGAETPARRERERMQARLFGVARHLFDRALSQDVLLEKTGGIVADIPEAKEWLFKRYAEDYLFPPFAPEVFPVPSLSELERWSAVGVYARALPTSRRRRASSYGFQKEITDYLESRDVDRQDEQTTSIIQLINSIVEQRKITEGKAEDTADRLEEVRRMKHNSLAEGGGGASKIDVRDPKLAPLLGRAMSSEGLKQKLFKRWLRDGLRAVSSDPVRATALVAEERMRSRGVLPREKEGAKTPESPSLFERLRRSRPVQRLLHEPDISTADAKREFSLAAAELFAAGFADNDSEMMSIDPNDFKPYE